MLLNLLVINNQHPFKDKLYQLVYKIEMLSVLLKLVLVKQQHFLFHYLHGFDHYQELKDLWMLIMDLMHLF
jgi:hypothetical protein